MPLNSKIHARSLPQSGRDGRIAVWLSAGSAAIYPWLLDAFHWAVTPAKAAAAQWLAGLLLMAAFALPLLNLLIAMRPRLSGVPAATMVRGRRFALMALTAPTAYVFFGVISYMAGSKVPDTWLWTPAWLLFGWLASRSATAPASTPASTPASLRVAHGVSGAVVAIYVLFHLLNHLFGLISPESHAAVMTIGRRVYRSAYIEPVLVAAMLFQVASGLRLAWRWSSVESDPYRVFQIASGVFLSLFILGHMNSVFFYARSWMGIPTDWAFAAGLPAGLLADAWNIRLLPHYALGVFFVLAHMLSGLRAVLLAHGVRRSVANRIWFSGAAISVLISAAIIGGMIGLRLN